MEAQLYEEFDPFINSVDIILRDFEEYVQARACGYWLEEGRD